MRGIGFGAIVLMLASLGGASAEQKPKVEDVYFIRVAQMSGALLTPIERHRIRRERIRIAAMEARARADGVVTRSERRQIRRAQKALDARIRAARAS